MGSTLTHKGYGRIYVETECDIEKVKKIINEIDPYEYDYLPKDLVATFAEYPKVTYIHKFSDMSMNQLQVMCWIRGIRILVIDNNSRDQMIDYTKGEEEN